MFDPQNLTVQLIIFARLYGHFKSCFTFSSYLTKINMYGFKNEKKSPLNHTPYEQ